MGKSEILTYPILKTYFKNLNIPVDRSSRIKSARSFLKAKQALDEGFSLIIFPEGGIPNTPPPKMAHFKDGAFKLALTANVPLIPVAFLNHYQLFSDPADVFGPARPGVSRVHIAEEVIVSEPIQDDKKKCHSLIQSQLDRFEKNR